MAFYKKFQSKLNDLWYPRAITTGIPITTDRIADKLSLQSTVTRGDTYAVLKNLGGVIADYMASGSTVKLMASVLFITQSLPIRMGLLRLKR